MRSLFFVISDIITGQYVVKYAVVLRCSIAVMLNTYLLGYVK